ncbi:hypothetical protein NDU88_000097 [Pleurodeles waltl]|uniref:Uncharacterized protein n=1 Tax=Pleurodeles waltl TaxID=8319 RepID=A0AAV7N8N7_PLEWA|nr:hypothetical protein NDU88_000097 [Pleurodeles waltl]
MRPRCKGIWLRAPGDAGPACPDGLVRSWHVNGCAPCPRAPYMGSERGAASLDWADPGRSKCGHAAVTSIPLGDEGWRLSSPRTRPMVMLRPRRWVSDGSGALRGSRRVLFIGRGPDVGPTGHCPGDPKRPQRVHFMRGRGSTHQYTVHALMWGPPVTAQGTPYSKGLPPCPLHWPGAGGVSSQSVP